MGLSAGKETNSSCSPGEWDAGTPSRAPNRSRPAKSVSEGWERKFFAVIKEGTYGMRNHTNDEVTGDREFVSLVRARLEASGHANVAIERSWIDDDTPGHPFLLNVPVGPELTIPLKPRGGFLDRQADDFGEHVDHFAKALVSLHRAQETLLEYAADVRAAAAAEIASARAEGLDLLLTRVGFKPTRAFHLTGNDPDDAVSHVLAAVTVRHTASHLWFDETELWIREPTDIATELSPLRDDQRKRQERMAGLDAIGADLEVDAITVALLEAHGFDVVQILRKARKKQTLNLAVEVSGGKTNLGIINSGGMVSASIQLEAAYWNGTHLWFVDEGMSTGHNDLIGKCLGDLLPHPVFTSLPIVKVERSHGGKGSDMIFFDMSDRLLFDADTGRLWRRERLAA